MDNREKMKQGYLYRDIGEGFPQQRLRCRQLVKAFNESEPNEEKQRDALLRELLPEVGKEVWIEPPVRFAYGNTHIGDYFYANFNLTIIDDVDVYIGDYVMIAPNVTISATGHPVHPDLRPHGEQFSFPIHIKDHVWIGAGVIILPGVTIGEGSVIGAGSIVTKDIPPYVVALGNPCRVFRKITDRDREYYFRDRKI